MNITAPHLSRQCMHSSEEGNTEQFATRFDPIIHKYTNNSINTEVRQMKMCVYMGKYVPSPYKGLKIAFGNKKIYFQVKIITKTRV